ncbi:RNA polymerase II subunit A C-terminal domain phosphatase SSU72 like protein 6-like [Microcebus murinus]|uniref:RNA polymerase II subunit A C-terminal domain phosphatase SSU72 like protein 6-like n=1 Tax=Microcebus murinus TaxID=30608 RepID=UPI003F6D2473
MSSAPLRVAVVCMRNVNRSMEAHSVLRSKGINVRSFAAGSCVKLPGRRPHLPVVYDFATTYRQMYDDLVRKDREFYTHNGILHILRRNERIKARAERFQECTDCFDVIFTCEESVYDKVVEHLCSREEETLQPVHVINVEVEDDPEGAMLGAFLICELCQGLQQLADTQDQMGRMLLQVEERTGKSFLHTVCFY